MQSKIFTEAEQKSIEERFKGSNKDSTGIFSARVRPKIIELIDYWFPLRNKLKKISQKKEKVIYDGN